MLHLSSAPRMPQLRSYLPHSCSMHASLLPHACLFLAPCMPHPCSRMPLRLLFPHFHVAVRPLQSDQRASITASSSQRRFPSQRSQREPRRRSLSPERPHLPTSDAKSDPSLKNFRLDFQAGTAGRVYSACAVCLGRHPHRIVECAVPMLWDNSLPSLALRSNKILSMRDGRAVCADWQRVSGCPSSRHDNRHICSGCASSSHGAQECSRAQKASGPHSL